MNKKVLIIFKYPRGNWNPTIIDKFSNYFETEHLYLSNYTNKNFTEVINEINNIITSKNIDIAVFDVDYFKFINFFFIKNINCKKKILITGDDFELHEMNSITAGACDLVLSHCPLSVLKYKEKGFESYIVDFEKGQIGQKDNVKKDRATNSYSFVGNLKRPFDTIQWLCPKAQSSNKNFGFLFYETLDGYNFRSIEKLLEEKPEVYEKPDRPIAGSFRIIENNLNQSNDIGHNCRMGMYANKTIYIALIIPTTPLNAKFENAFAFF